MQSTGHVIEVATTECLTEGSHLPVNSYSGLGHDEQ